MSEDNYYELLGVTPDASPSHIEEQFGLLEGEVQRAMEDIPVTNKEYAIYRALLTSLNEAFTVLSDSELRAAYDNKVAGEEAERATGPRLYAVPDLEEKKEDEFRPLINALSEKSLNRDSRIAAGRELIGHLVAGNRWRLLVEIADTKGIPFETRELAFEKMVLVMQQTYEDIGEIPEVQEYDAFRLVTTQILQLPIRTKIGSWFCEFFSENGLWEQLTSFAGHPDMPAGVRSRAYSLIPKTLQITKQLFGTVAPEFIDDVHRLVVRGSSLPDRTELGRKCADFFAEQLDWNFLVRLAENKLAPPAVREHSLEKLVTVSQSVHSTFHVIPNQLHKAILRLLTSNISSAVRGKIGRWFAELYGSLDLRNMLLDITRDALVPQTARDKATDLLGPVSATELHPNPVHAVRRKMSQNIPQPPRGKPILTVLPGGKK